MQSKEYKFIFSQMNKIIFTLEEHQSIPFLSSQSILLSILSFDTIETIICNPWFITDCLSLLHRASVFLCIKFFSILINRINTS